jgi:hypothetical protein
MVATEIGELPPDLWTLIGQPAPSVNQPDSGANGGKTVMAKRDEEGEGNGSVAPNGPSALDSSPDLSNYIQRVEEEGGEPSAADETPTAAPLVAGEEEAGEKKEGEKVDINELARQVYAHLRGQLAADKERERGRLTHNW